MNHHCGSDYWIEWHGEKVWRIDVRHELTGNVFHQSDGKRLPRNWYFVPTIDIQEIDF